MTPPVAVNKLLLQSARERARMCNRSVRRAHNRPGAQVIRPHVGARVQTCAASGTVRVHFVLSADYVLHDGGRRCEYQSLRDDMLTAIPRAGALREGALLSRKQPGVYSAQPVEAQTEEDEEGNLL